MKNLRSKDLAFDEQIFDVEISKACKVCGLLVNPIDHIKLLVESANEITLHHFCDFSCLIENLESIKEFMEKIYN